MMPVHLLAPYTWATNRNRRDGVFAKEDPMHRSESSNPGGAMDWNGSTPTQPADQFFAALDPFLSARDGEAVWSQSRCVDVLLDLYNATDSPAVRDVISDMLDDMRHLSSVRADEMRGHVVLLAAAASVEAAFLAAA
jgi:hypothetical protein